MSTRTQTGVPWAGLAAGPGAWAVNTQTNYALVPWICASKINLVPIVAVVLALLALAGAFLSWRSWQASGGSERHWSSMDGQPRNFLAGVGTLAGLLFALVILTQGAAAFVLQGCER